MEFGEREGRKSDKIESLLRYDGERVVARSPTPFHSLLSSIRRDRPFFGVGWKSVRCPSAQ